MSLGTPQTVNDVMEWLNARFGQRIPLLPLTGWPQALKHLWRMVVPGPLPPPQDPFPWRIEVEGNFEGLLPEGNTLDVRATILIGTTSIGSPDLPPNTKGRHI